MRLKEIQRILSNISFDDVGLKYEYNPNGPDVIKNINKFKWFLSVIKPISIYDDEISKLNQSEIYQTAQDFLELNSSKAREISNISRYLVNSASSLK